MMIGGIGLPELIVIFLVLVLLFGAKRLPQLGGAIGESIKNFKKGIDDSSRDLASDESKKLEASQTQKQTTSGEQS